MSTFELDTPHQAKLQDVIVLSDKDRAPDTNPGVGLDFSMTVANDMLTLFDGGLRSALFTKTAASSAPAQATLEGVPAISDMPNLTGIGKAIGQFGWDLELTGYELTLDHGMGGPKSDITLEDCKLTNWRFKCKEGGSVEVKFRVESPDVSEKTHGKLALLKTREFPILLTAPVVQQGDIEEEHAAPARTSAPREEQTPESALAASVNGGAPPDAPTDLAPSAAWPFPTNTNVKKPDVSVKRGRPVKA